MAVEKSPYPVTICIVGPTGSGKSELAQRVSLRVGGEVVSADSMQVYTGMDIGTGKVAVGDRLVPHWGLDLVAPGAQYSASLYQGYARDKIAEIAQRRKAPVVCGGTGFYIRAAIDAYDFPEGEQVGNPVRDRWTKIAQEQGSQVVWEELNRRDPASAQAVHPNNVKRVVRALELQEQGVSYAEQIESLHHIEQVVPAIFFAIEMPREELYNRIERRVDTMIESGLVNEVRSLLDAGYREGVTAQQAIGYKEIVEYIEGRCELADAVEQIKQATRRYAKRQISWFRNDKRVTWLNAENMNVDDMANFIQQEYAASVQKGSMR